MTSVYPLAMRYVAFYATLFLAALYIARSYYIRATWNGIRQKKKGGKRYVDPFDRLIVQVQMLPDFLGIVSYTLYFGAVLVGYGEDTPLTGSWIYIAAIAYIPLAVAAYCAKGALYRYAAQLRALRSDPTGDTRGRLDPAIKFSMLNSKMMRVIYKSISGVGTLLVAWLVTLRLYFLDSTPGVTTILFGIVGLAITLLVIWEIVAGWRRYMRPAGILQGWAFMGIFWILYLACFLIAPIFSPSMIGSLTYEQTSIANAVLVLVGPAVTIGANWIEAEMLIKSHFSGLREKYAV